jgi:hypothetical protein
VGQPGGRATAAGGRYRRQLGADAMRPSVGRLRIDGDSITPEIVALT